MSGNTDGLMALWIQGDWVIRCVALLLLGMSILSWFVILKHVLAFFRFKKLYQIIPAFWQTPSLDAGKQVLAQAGADNPLIALIQTGEQACQTHQQPALQEHISLSEWLTQSLHDTLDMCTENMQGGLSILASIGATAPFVGLFGTVWGIYHALIGISASGQARIDQVAGPIGEALIMTALGLAVAIPAVLGYNAFIRLNRRTLAQLNRFAKQVHTCCLTGARMPENDVSNPLKTRP